MRIAQIVSRYHWETKLDRSRWLSVEPLQPFRTGNGWEGYNQDESIKTNLRRLMGELPDVVIAYKPLDHIGFNTLPCTTVLQFNECRDKRFPGEVSESQPNLVVFHHKTDHFKWQAWLAEREIQHAHIPHVADPAIFYDRGGERPIDFLLVGALGDKVYPLRRKFMEALPLIQSAGLRAEYHQHPGHTFASADTLEHLHTFAAALNRAKVVGFCSSIYRYRLQKYVEVPACGAVVAADQPIARQPEVGMILCDAENSPSMLATGIVRGLNGLDGTEANEVARTLTPEWYCEQLQTVLSNAR